MLMSCLLKVPGPVCAPHGPLWEIGCFVARWEKLGPAWKLSRVGIHVFTPMCERVLYIDPRTAHQTVEQEETERFAVILQPGLQIDIFCSFLVNTAVILHSFQKSMGPSQVVSLQLLVEMFLWDRRAPSMEVALLGIGHLVHVRGTIFQFR